jgi:DNA-binding protein H-NS
MPSLNDLISQKTALDKQIIELQRAGRVAAVTQIRSLMSEYSLSVADVLSPAEKRKMTAGAPAAAVTVAAAAPAAPAKRGPKAKKAAAAAPKAPNAPKMQRAAKSTRAGKALGKVAIKYRNKETGDTWTGRGLKPRWLAAALAAGKSLADFAV